MPPSNKKRQPQDSRPWRRLTNMDRRSTLQSDGRLGYRNAETDSFRSRRLRPRWLSSRDRDGPGDGDGDDDDDGDRDGGDGGRNGPPNFRDFSDGPGDGVDGGQSNGFGKHDGGSRDFNGDDFSDDDSDAEDNGGVPQRTMQTTIASSSGSIVTLTALPPSQATDQSDILTTLTPQIATPSPPVLNPIKLPTSPTTTPTTTLAPMFTVPSDRKEEDGMTTLLSSTTEIQPTLTTTPLQIATETTSSIMERPSKDFSMDDNDNNNKGNNGNNNNNDWWKHRGHGDKNNNNNNNSRGGLDSTAEHLLIAAGAIGAFILLCFIGWVIYRVLKRPKGGKGGAGFIDKLSWRRKPPMEGTWDGRTLYMANEAPPNYEKGEYGTMISGNFYAAGKVYPPGPGSIVHPVASNSETGTLRRPLNDTLAPASMTDQYLPGNDAASINNNVNLTLRSQMSQSQPYYKESEIPRPPPENRASQLSSISSGFGDGDIIIPPPMTYQKPLPAPGSNIPIANEAGKDDPATRDSWVSRDGERRETMYTTTSEDRPARFRSITSWVNQQAGRAKRAGSRARERGEVPVMPAVPGEINMTRQTAYR
ncbi:hypothetical protein F4818DRAFT_171758 [Hypoxylon cercidicola]|nr:hypothetical protein F4818DRAFT_171758 [Hypoxylon cercidicola]